MKILDDPKLDFCDVLILPKRSSYSSRSEVFLERKIQFKYAQVSWSGVPIMVSNMDTTGTIEMAKALQEYKIITCLHKYYTADDIPDDLNREYYAVSSGIQQADLTNLDEIIKKVNPKFICLDVANGYMQKFVSVCNQIRELYPDKVIIAGNVCTAEGVLDLVLNGKADIVKCGIGPGSQCLTRKQTGVGMPQLSCIMESADTAHGLDAQIIGDGGIQVNGDFAKAFGAGADFVMAGGLFGGYKESGGDTILDTTDNQYYKLIYGMSSTTAMNKYQGGVAEHRSSEGKTVKVKYRGDVKNFVLDLFGSLRSTMTYINAKRIKDIPKCTTFIRVNRQLNNMYNSNEI
jgi:GMP reductase